ncbi:Fosfomycin biosynthesis bifunctional protein Fom1 [Includes: 2-hydroxyethylphosphonate cytidylyltransferase, partial [Durusdinium trenchii]
MARTCHVPWESNADEERMCPLRPLQAQNRARGASTAGSRLPTLKRLIQEKPIVRAIEVHSGFSALVVDAAVAQRRGEQVTFDCLWSSSLTSSAIKGKPDIETVTTSERMQIVDDVLEVSTKPVLYDGDTGGPKE